TAGQDRTEIEREAICTDRRTSVRPGRGVGASRIRAPTPVRSHTVWWGGHPKYYCLVVKFAVNGSCCSPARVIAPGRLFHERPPGGWGRPVWGTAPGRAGTDCRTPVRTSRGVGAEGHRRRLVTLLDEFVVDGRHRGDARTDDA